MPPVHGPRSRSEISARGAQATVPAPTAGRCPSYPAYATAAAGSVTTLAGAVGSMENQRFASASVTNSM